MILLSAASGMGPWSAVLAWTGGGCDVCLIRSIGWVQLRLVRLSFRGPGLVVLAAGTVCPVDIQISLSRETVRPSHIPVWL